MDYQQIAILGATGSIGQQTLEVVSSMPDKLSVGVMTASTNWTQLATDALKYRPSDVVIADEKYYQELKTALDGSGVNVHAGSMAINEVVTLESVDTVVSAIVGYAGLHPTVKAIESGKKIALANKETLVVAGELVMSLAKKNNVDILPVDSEHSAIFQSLAGENSEIEKLLLTASGGPFFGYTKEQLEEVTLEQALKHPNWVMGRKITIDSATLMNKGLEVIEAAWLFGVDVDNIEVLVHPKSIVHSLVQFTDGGVKAQLGTPDMKLPIQYALTYPYRKALCGDRLNLIGQTLEFKSPDTEAFPCLTLAYEAYKKGGSLTCAMNAANEVAVDMFLNRKIRFTDIPKIIEKTMHSVYYIDKPTLDDYQQVDKSAREIAQRVVIK